MFEYDIAEYSQINPDLYRRELRRLQAEFLKLQKWIIEEKKKIAIVFEGRDTAGKTGSISVLSKYLIPEHVRLVKLGIPTQRQYKNFMKRVIPWEKELLDNGTEIVKIYLSVEKNIQKKRSEKRRNSPLIFWKFSEDDLKVADRWDAFTFYKDQMFSSTSHEESPWVIINANTKMVAALNSLRYILEKFDYPEKNIPKPKVWSEGMNIYNLKINGVLFENLSYDQFKVLNSFADES